MRPSVRELLPACLGGRRPHPFIIAEAGVNHNGDLGLAARLVLAAKKAGADAVKFQTFRTGSLVSRSAPKADYQKARTRGPDSQASMLRALELDRAAHEKLKKLCSRTGILFLSTPFDSESADLLDEIGVPLFKLGSGEVTNRPLLEHVAAKGRPMILSTGMSTLAEVATAVGWVKAVSKAPLVLLHCVTEYPAPPDQANLKAILTMARALHLPVGWSDHTEGSAVSVAAAALGAPIIEKHLTIDRTLPGPDHAASLEPAAFAAFAADVRTAVAALGNGAKRPAACERRNLAVGRRSLTLVTALPKGSVLKSSDLAVKRPGTGIPPSMLHAVVGRTLSRDLAEDETLTWAALAARDRRPRRRGTCSARRRGLAARDRRPRRRRIA
ncbi:MAG: N-acetylneuraminate synthase [Elusimicrobia bacterium]|nr:N-acetylneuraminate synthase [Elusimicrobiota bacterium]